MILKEEKVAKFLGFDLSTTALAAGVLSEKGRVEDFVSIPIRGAVKWLGQPAFDLSYIPGMILDALEALRKNGWSFHHYGSLSFSVRQHDMVLADREMEPCCPALSWRCNAAVSETRFLKDRGVEKMVGKIEERFILPKLAWVLGEMPELREKLLYVMTTGDYIATLLTGRARLSTSDALSNGLLLQKTKKLAVKAMTEADLAPVWFPDPIQSGRIVGTVNHDRSLPEGWGKISWILKGWKFIASLGDNHAGGVGCGLADDRTIVISAGSSGTVIRRCQPGEVLLGSAACFEYYKDRLLLMMLADCAIWYDRFVRRYGKGYPLRQLDGFALAVDPRRLRRVRKVYDGSRNWKEAYPDDWASLSLGERVASTQASIALELLILAKKMLQEVPNGTQVGRFVITGGLSQSQFFQNVLEAGLSLLLPRAKVVVSNRCGPLASQSATLGALINAMVGIGFYPSLAAAVSELCPLQPSCCSTGGLRKSIQGFLVPRL